MFSTMKCIKLLFLSLLIVCNGAIMFYSFNTTNNNIGQPGSAPQRIVLENILRCGEVFGVHSQKNNSTRDGSFTFNTKIIYTHIPAHWLVDWVGTKWGTSDIFKQCPVSNCILSQDNKHFDTSDAVIIRPFSNCMKKKKMGQVWIFMEHEAPPNFGRTEHFLKECHRNIFNWTFTYRRDSDFTLDHGYFTPQADRSNNKRLEQSLRSKTRSAVGFISNCHTQSQRGRYIENLRKSGLDLDIVGNCGNMKCKNDNRHKTSWNTSGVTNYCFDVLNNKYRFYFSFENALCADYVTEKSLNLIMSRDIVPIIRDGANHELYHPPGSYIHTSDFASAKELTEYVLKVGKNESRYSQYFNWRKHYSIHGIIDVLQRNFCEMCKRLHDPDKYRRLYGDLGTFWWNSGGGKACNVAKDI